ncbi:MAG: PQQ-dependent sugar dehydrogenase [Acidobacteriales bacterium]|nr:PQQ-dependent sugar dehydrogenase [Terriglobales bacterium]
MLRKSGLFCVSVAVTMLLGCGGSGSSDSGGGTTPPPSPATDQTLVTEDFATHLETPWSMVFAPDGRLFFTEQPGRLRVITNAGLQATPVLDLTGVTVGGEGGTTGMDLDPNFSSNGYIYLHYCLNDGSTHCRVDRVVVNSSNLGTIDLTLLDYPVTSGNFDHTGGRLRVGPDNLLYLSTGDHQNEDSAQDPASWDGKILRMNLDGTAAAGNSFPENPYVYTLGHRDPQGLAWDSSGTLYETEHGPTANDEVNIIEAGQNYGWPTCVGTCNNPNFTDPIKLFTAETIPPSGATFYHGSVIPGWDGTLLFAVLGQDDNTDAHHVHQLQFSSDGRSIIFEQTLWQNQFGRIRDVVEGPDGFLYFSTSNIPAQGTLAGPDDDRIIRAHP